MNIMITIMSITSKKIRNIHVIPPMNLLSMETVIVIGIVYISYAGLR